MTDAKYAISLFGRIEPNQAIFVHHLRTNPNNVEQISGELVNGSGQMCALGLGMEAFDMIEKYLTMSEEADPYATYEGYDPYKEISAVLNIPESHVHQIYALNDDYEMTFGGV